MPPMCLDRSCGYTWLDIPLLPEFENIAGWELYWEVYGIVVRYAFPSISIIP